QSLRGIRYCEILVPEIGGARDGIAMRVYTTQGLNDCPLATWEAIDARTEARRLGVPMVFKNGPRFVAYDQISANIDGAVESFEGLDMQLVATLELPAGPMPQDRPAYSGMVVARNTDYIYLAGQPVFELVAPDGGIYVMQTYVAPDDPHGDFSVLAGLAGRLTLPDGWSFREFVPDEDLHAATTNGQATVIRDDLGNTYQWLTGGDATPVPAS
ncbi:MAG: hypothetical protein M3Z20_21350, partial [Chloroflexota bacterium]|nr:hypothetical protein [Chloroflexota bacterium]